MGGIFESRLIMVVVVVVVVKGMAVGREGWKGRLHALNLFDYYYYCHENNNSNNNNNDGLSFPLFSRTTRMMFVLSFLFAGSRSSKYYYY